MTNIVLDIELEELAHRLINTYPKDAIRSFILFMEEEICEEEFTRELQEALSKILDNCDE